MIADLTSVVLTAHVAHWADQSARIAWIIDCIRHHNAGDWGDLDSHDWCANDRAVRLAQGRIRARYPVPTELAELEDSDDALWVITDDLASLEAERVRRLKHSFVPICRPNHGKHAPRERVHQATAHIGPTPPPQFHSQNYYPMGERIVSFRYSVSI
jgi:hypothetical protein